MAGGCTRLPVGPLLESDARSGLEKCGGELLALLKSDRDVTTGHSVAPPVTLGIDNQPARVIGPAKPVRQTPDVEQFFAGQLPCDREHLEGAGEVEDLDVVEKQDGDGAVIHEGSAERRAWVSVNCWKRTMRPASAR